METNKYSRVLRAVQRMPWAILPSKLCAIVDMLAMRANGQEIDADVVRALIEAQEQRRQQNATRPVTVGVIPVYGTITQRADMFSDWSGGTSCEAISRDLHAFIANDAVEAIVLDVDSPGGTVYGVQELSDEIHAARGTKPIVASVNSLCASAAYWIASAADEVAITPSGELGSIGVYAAHTDYSEFENKMGLKTTLVSAGKYKTEGNPFEPLSEESRAALQTSVDEFYGMFTESVARNRGYSKTQVRDGFGEGRVVGARDAIVEGMADRVETYKDTLANVIDRAAITSGARWAARRGLLTTSEEFASAAKDAVADIASDYVAKLLASVRSGEMSWDELQRQVAGLPAAVLEAEMPHQHPAKAAGTCPADLLAHIDTCARITA